MKTQLAAAYATCRAIARGSATNFYYAFLALPREKRNAICAVYAFMRHADDICDDANVPFNERRGKLADWLGAAHRVFQGQRHDDAVLFALADAQRRFKIPVELFDQLVAGTAMDLDIHAAAGDADAPAVLCQTFDDLYRYCYHVASVVGLVCIRIFGYRDPAAEPLAERCGVAFQLTNIIRDVREDAQMGRIYLPAEDLHRFELTPDRLSAQSLRNGFQPGPYRPLLEFEAARAREFYSSTGELMKLIDEESRPAFWVLVEIYRRLLEKITRQNYDVFTKRVQLGRVEKLSILSRGLLRRLV
ncbi:MAG: phytoene/squalene synthase family protein [Acidobacteriales bacterium]|nr:phytoene/squalene synthase family protein [Terriglobales bacterium]